ncbi:hypothetical protein KKG45_05930 [bacterium]|nr:hypothetical protein [bacterium]MBU1072766.1 hypothetical protein [bacterium]MBU1675587.1 hypothetical protein [bacterium]
MLLQPGSPLAGSCDGPVETGEVGGTVAAPAGIEPPVDLASLAAELSFFAGYAVFNEQDMYDTYGGMPQVGLEASVGTGEDVRFVLGIRYGAVSGDPFYDTPDFDGSGDARLRAVPVTAGLRVNASENPRFRLYWGACFEAVWMEEKVPDPDVDTAAAHRTDRGWGRGLQLSVTPEWRSHDQRRAAGLTLWWGGSSGKVGKGGQDHEVNMIGMGARLHYARAI